MQARDRKAIEKLPVSKEPWEIRVLGQGEEAMAMVAGATVGLRALGPVAEGYDALLVKACREPASGQPARPPRFHVADPAVEAAVRASLKGTAMRVVVVESLAVTDRANAILSALLATPAEPRAFPGFDGDWPAWREVTRGSEELSGALQGYELRFELLPGLAGRVLECSDADPDRPGCVSLALFPTDAAWHLWRQQIHLPFDQVKDPVEGLVFELFPGTMLEPEEDELLAAHDLLTPGDRSPLARHLTSAAPLDANEQAALLASAQAAVAWARERSAGRTPDALEVDTHLGRVRVLPRGED